MQSLITSLGLGLLTPLTAVCVLPLYPGFVAMLAARQDTQEQRSPAALGALVMSGVLVFTSCLGLVFSALLRVSLTTVTQIVSPIAFTVLAVVAVLLLLDIDLSAVMPRFRTPLPGRPGLRAFAYGLFFGAIVLPCNPGLIAAFFATSIAASTGDYLLNVASFVAFGIGIGLPLLVLAVISTPWQHGVIGFLTRHRRYINLFTGALLLGVSLYYLIAVFRVFG